MYKNRVIQWRWFGLSVMVTLAAGFYLLWQDTAVVNASLNGRVGLGNPAPPIAAPIVLLFMPAGPPCRRWCAARADDGDGGRDQFIYRR